MNIKQLAKSLRSNYPREEIYIYKNKNRWLYTTDKSYTKGVSIKYTALIWKELSTIEREIRDLFYEKQKSRIKQVIKNLNGGE